MLMTLNLYLHNVKLQAKETDLKVAEEQVKKLKKEVDHLSGESSQR